VHCLHGLPNRGIRSQLSDTRRLPACDGDPKKASAKVSRRFRRLPAHGLSAKISRTRRWRITEYGRQVRGTTLYLREHHVPNVYASVMHRSSSLVEKGLARHQAASRSLHDLAHLGVLREMPFGKEKLFIQPRLLQLLGQDRNAPQADA